MFLALIDFDVMDKVDTAQRRLRLMQVASFYEGHKAVYKVHKQAEGVHATFCVTFPSKVKHVKSGPADPSPHKALLANLARNLKDIDIMAADPVVPDEGPGLMVPDRKIKQVGSLVDQRGNPLGGSIK